MNQDFECPRCGHCCQSEVSEDMKHIKTWNERQEEIDELRQALETEQESGAWISERGDVFLLVNGIWMKWDLSCES